MGLVLGILHSKPINVFIVDQLDAAQMSWRVESNDKLSARTDKTVWCVGRGSVIKQKQLISCNGIVVLITH